MKLLLENAEKIDILWVLTCGALVFFMQAGFTCLESGLTRKKNSINVALKKITGFCITGAMFFLLGFRMIFGDSTVYGFVGLKSPTMSANDINTLVLFFYELMFAGCAVTIISGAVAERVKFSAYLVMVALMGMLVYPFVGHWIWSVNAQGMPQGFLNRLGFMDFAGSTVVHASAGWSALACVIVLGPRAGRFGKNGQPNEITGNDIPLSILGAFILWVGWIGFNGGSALKFTERVPMIITCTMLSGVFGLLSCLACDWVLKGYARVDAAINGALGGLVGVTASSNIISTTSAISIGLISGVIVLLAERALLRAKWDDAVGAFPVHGACGIFGTLAVALFGDTTFFDGRSALEQFNIQFYGTLVVFVWSMGIMFCSLKLIDKFIYKLRISEEQEKIGLNVVEHRASSEILDLFNAMENQANTGDLSIRVHEEPFTEVGQIAQRYNRVLDKIEVEIEVTKRMQELAEMSKNDAIEAKEKLKSKVAELKKFNRFTVGREMSMIELKKEINRLCVEQGKKPKFDTDALEEDRAPKGSEE